MSGEKKIWWIKFLCFRYVQRCLVQCCLLWGNLHYMCLSCGVLLSADTETLKKYNLCLNMCVWGGAHTCTPSFQDLSLHICSNWFHYFRGFCLFEVLCELRVGFECIMLVCFSYYSNRGVIYSLLISGFKGWVFFSLIKCGWWISCSVT